MTNKLESVKKALEEIKKREQERVDKQQSLGNFPIEASVLIIVKEALVEINEVIIDMNSDELVIKACDAFIAKGISEDSFARKMAKEGVLTSDKRLLQNCTKAAINIIRGAGNE